MNRCRILSIDDNPDNNEIIQEILCDDYEVRIASSGEEGLEVASEFKPHLILLDIMMPGIDGYETCRRIKADPTLKDTIVIMVSAKELVDDKVEGYEVGAYDYITKPFSEEDLKDSVEYFLNKDAYVASPDNKRIRFVN